MDGDPIARVRALAASLPGVEDRSGPGAVRLDIGGKGIAWTLNERVHPKKPRVPVPEVLAVGCDQARKEFLIEAAPDSFYSTPHYAGYPAVLVRLAAVDDAELLDLLAAAVARRR
jgi:hypothetical protein